MTTIAITEITTKQLHHARLAKVTKLADILAAEYPGLSLVANIGELDRVDLFLVTGVDEAGETVAVYEGKEVPELADLLESAEDLGVDPEQGAGDGDDEPKASGSVVHEGYRAKYREVSSTKQSCGDWLAEQLAIDTMADGQFQVADFDAILSNNSVDRTGAWARLPQSGQKGWVGRWRMNGRQILEKVVALTGVYLDATGAKHEPEAGWLAGMRTKHAKWIEKQAKIEAAHRSEE